MATVAGVQTASAHWAQIGPELAGADEAWRSGNAGRGRVGARRAAGMALKAWLCLQPRDGYGTSFMHHLGALADDESVAYGAREAAWRLCARPVPEAGFQLALPAGLTPLDDARTIIDLISAELPALSAGR